jgi:hypothetical protein
MAAKLTRLTHKIAIQLRLVVDNCTICSFRSRWPVREIWIHSRISLLPQYVFIAWCLTKHRDNFTLLHLVPFSLVSSIYESRDSSVGIALGYGLDDQGPRVRFQAWAGNFSLHHRVQNGSGAHPPIQWVPGAFSLEIKRQGRESDHSPPSSAEVKECVELYLYSPNTPLWCDA